MPKRDIAKYAINAAITGTLEKVLRRAVEANTDIVVEDSIPARIGTAGVAMYAGSLTKPYVSDAVEKIADWRTARKEAKNVVAAVVE